MRPRKLEKFAKFLDGLKLTKRQSFDMASWHERTECGTACCAIGWGAMKGALPGMELRKLEFWGWRAPHFKNKTDLDAVALYFDIPFEEAEYLFGPYTGATCPADVAANIRKLVKS